MARHVGEAVITPDDRHGSITKVAQLDSGTPVCRVLFDSGADEWFDQDVLRTSEPEAD